MNKIKSIFPLLGNIFKSAALVSMLATNLFMGYTLFAPDSFPKPYYINHRTMVVLAPIDEGSTTTETEGHTAEPTAVANPLEVFHPGDGLMVDTGTKIVNLADPGGRRYLKTTITIEVAPPPELQASAEAETETEASGGHGASTTETENTALTAFNDKMNADMPVINDILTTLLSSKTFEGIYTIEGKELLRQEIQANLNERLPDLYVISVYFTEFIVQ